MKEIKLELTIEETNQILDALGNLPFKSVFGLIGKIQSQAGNQLNDKGNVKDLLKKESEPTPLKKTATK